MAWSPKILRIGEKVSFLLDFPDTLTNKRLHLLPYDFVIIQDGKELLRRSGLSQVGSDVQEFRFTNPGAINITIENVGGSKQTFTVFNSTVYQNPNISQAGINELQQSQNNKLPTNPFQVNTL